MTNLSCDYLVVGAGAASLAFLDTLLTELPDKKVVLVDKKARPGGHWVDDYDFVRLHQPSIVYGIPSRQLEGNWAKLLFGKFTLPWKHRASKRELLEYFQDFVDEKVRSGHVEYYPECVFDFDRAMDDDDANAVVTFASLDGQRSYAVEIRDKLVNGVQGECVIPSLTPPSFPVDDGVRLMTPNEVYELQQSEYRSRGGARSISKRRMPKAVVSKRGRTSDNNNKDRHFVVLGAGKTAMDTVVFLQDAMGISPSDISWVIPNDVWMLSRENGQGPFGYFQALLDADNDKEEAARRMEEAGQFVRLDPNVVPTRFRFPTVGADEVKAMRKVKHTIRRGRVSSISLEGGGDIRVAFERDGEDDWVLPASSDGKERIFVHCTSPGPFNGKEYDGRLFPSGRRMVLDLLFAPPVSLSMSCLARLEAARQRGTLDVMFGRAVLGDDDGMSADRILDELIRSLFGEGRGDEETTTSEFLDEMRSIVTQAMFLALVDEDPDVGCRWLKSNRLSMMSVPGFKGRFVEDLESILEKGTALGAPADRLEAIRKVAEKLEPLRGK